jgi:RHS repeat-associated protein
MALTGRDRITKYEWTDAGQLYRTISGYGTAVQREDARYSYNDNGAVTQAVDGKGNVTSYEYDGYDRPLRTCYNTATCNSAASDQVLIAYGTTGNSAGRITQQGVRGSAATVYTAYTYDALGRVTNIDYPGTGAFDKDVALSYDNFGQMTLAQDANGHQVSYVYDVLGRPTRQGTQSQSLAMGYDNAGRRTRLTWDDNSDTNINDFYVTYEYDATGALKVIKENGSTALATYAYEALGRRQSLTLGNGAVTSYSYTGPTLTGLGFDLAGANTTYDQSIAFQYNAAGQIISRVTSNNSYAWTGAVSTARTYASNALNQYTQVGSVTPTYDVKGNLTKASSLEGSGATWTYNVNNALVSSSTGTQFYQDPIGRLKQIGSGTNWRIFEYDGAHVASERRSSDQAIVHRYVFGPGDDEPLVWYDYSSGTLAKKFLTADERGSVVAVTNSSGAVLKINSYDEYGISASGNVGMFQYTGQAWLPELGMYNYKARIYSPTLGRFLQTDPIGYGDGMGRYNYVGGDPVNFTDTSGLEGKTILVVGRCPTDSYLFQGGCIKKISRGNGQYNYYPTQVICPTGYISYGYSASCWPVTGGGSTNTTTKQNTASQKSESFFDKEPLEQACIIASGLGYDNTVSAAFSASGGTAGYAAGAAVDTAIARRGALAGSRSFSSMWRSALRNGLRGATTTGRFARFGGLGGMAAGVLLGTLSGIAVGEFAERKCGGLIE